MVHSLYNSAKLNSDHVQRFPALLPKIANPEQIAEEKALLFVNEHYPSKVATRLPVRAILLPRVTGLAETRLKRVSVAMALAALAPSTIFQLPRAGSRHLSSWPHSRVSSLASALKWARSFHHSTRNRRIVGGD